MYGDRSCLRSNPFFLSRNIYLLGIGIGDGKARSDIACDGVSVVGNIIFFDRIDNLGTVGFVFTQTVEAALPVASLIKGECLAGINTICKKMYRYRTCLRSNPNLGYRN